MTIRLYAALALSFTMLFAGSAGAKSVSHTHHAKRQVVHRNIDVRYAQGFYDYRAQDAVREEFRDGPGRQWRQGRYFDREDFYSERYDSRVVENLRTEDFTGGVGYGLNGDVFGGGGASFVDGFGQRHFFVGSFRRMAPVPSRFGAPRFGGPRFGGGFRGGFR